MEPLVFLDVGAHVGQTLEEVVKPEYGFDAIYAFEPMPAQYATLVERFGDDRRVRLLPFGLARSTGKRRLFGLNDQMEASLYARKRDVDPKAVTVCSFVEASAWFQALGPDPRRLVVKLNCEGAEVEILENLIDSGEIWKITNVVIDFDVRKVRGMEAAEPRLLERLARIGFDRHRLFEDVMGDGETHQARIANWLRGVL